MTGIEQFEEFLFSLGFEKAIGIPGMKSSYRLSMKNGYLDRFVHVCDFGDELLLTYGIGKGPKAEDLYKLDEDSAKKRISEIHSQYMKWFKETKDKKPRKKNSFSYLL